MITVSTMRIAVVQAAYELMDRAATLEKTLDVIGEAARGGAGLVAFPEVFIPGTPIWIDSGPIWEGDAQWYALLVDQAVVIPGPVTDAIGRGDVTCPKSWRHTFATLLQDTNVDPLIRQLTLGHKPTSGGGLGMTANYTHTRLETQRAQIEQALRHWPDSLNFSTQWLTGGLP